MNTHALQPIMDAVQQASQLCQTVQAHYMERGHKANREPVTIADYGSQVIICQAIRQVFPDDAILSEEAGEQFATLITPQSQQTILDVLAQVTGQTFTVDEVVDLLDYGKGRSAARTWVIDPIDGTKGFLQRRRYAIAVGCLEAGQPVAAVMGCPAYPLDGNGQGRLFVAAEGQAFSRPLQTTQPLDTVQVSDHSITDPVRITQSVETAHVDHELMAAVYEAAGLTQPMPEGVDGQDKYAMIAAGDAELYLRIPPTPTYRPKVWDHAAGTALVQAAGGQVTDQRGQPLDFSQGSRLSTNTTIVVTNGHIHANILAALQTVLAEG